MKIEGDGAQATLQKDVCVLSAVLLDSDNIFRVIGREVLACVAGKECYDLWEVCFGPTISKINEYERVKKVKMQDGTEVEIELYLGGDYKFLLQVMGMNAANSQYACLFCFVHKVSPCAQRKQTPQQLLHKMASKYPPYYTYTCRIIADNARRRRPTARICCAAPRLLLQLPLALRSSASAARRRLPARRPCPPMRAAIFPTRRLAWYVCSAAHRLHGSCSAHYELSCAQTKRALFAIPLDRVVPCLMHALLRVTDRLEAGVVSQVPCMQTRSSHIDPCCAREGGAQ